MDLYVGNIPFDATDVQLAQLFEQYGTVQSAKIIVERETQRSRGFGFVRMENASQAQAAIKGLNDYLWEVGGRGRNLSVRQAEARQQGSGGRPQDRRFDSRQGGTRNRW